MINFPTSNNIMSNYSYTDSLETNIPPSSRPPWRDTRRWVDCTAQARGLAFQQCLWDCHSRSQPRHLARDDYVPHCTWKAVSDNS